MGFEEVEALSTSPPRLSTAKNINACHITKPRHPTKRAPITIALLALLTPAARFAQREPTLEGDLTPRVRVNHVGATLVVAPVGSTPACTGKPASPRKA